MICSLRFFYNPLSWQISEASSPPCTQFSPHPFVSIPFSLLIDYSRNKPFFPLVFLFFSLSFFFFNGYISLSLTAMQCRASAAGLSSPCWVGQQGFNSKAPRINTSLWLVLILSLLMVDVCCQNSWKVSAVICCAGYGDFNEQSPSYIWDHLQNPLRQLTGEILEIFHVEKQPNPSCCNVFCFIVGLVLPQIGHFAARGSSCAPGLGTFSVSIPTPVAHRCYYTSH